MRDKIVIISIAVLAIVIGVLVFLSGGTTVSQKEYTSEPNNPVTVVPVPFTKIVTGTKSTVATRANYLITSASELTELWKMIDAKGKPPVVDFTKEAVIAVFAGKESTSSIAIAKIEDAQTRTVSISITKPEGSCANKIAATSPYMIAAVAASSLPLTHHDVLTTTKCN